MIKNYLLIYSKIVFFFGALLIALPVLPQEPKIFTRSDFDLTGPVKTCRVITDYGKEDFEFNSEGLLTKSITRYSKNDYDVSYYKYQDQRLVERRDERYQDGNFDEITSMAHFYSYDSLSQIKVTERILSYDKEFQEQYEYFYNPEGQLTRMLRSHAEGIDETTLDYSIYKDESTVTYMMNGLLQKTIRSSVKTQDNGEEMSVELIKYFIEGVPEKATERILNSKGLLVSELNFIYSPKEKSFVPLTNKVFIYDEQDKLESVTSTTGKLKNIKEYLYQFDADNGGNWVKKVISPENSYTTRVIEYYDLVRTPDRQ